MCHIKFYSRMFTYVVDCGVVLGNRILCRQGSSIMVCPQKYYNYYPTVATVVGMVLVGTISPWRTVEVFE